MSWDNSVSNVTDCRMDHKDSVPCMCRDIPGACQSYPEDTRGSFPGGKVVPRFRMSLYTFMEWFLETRIVLLSTFDKFKS